MYIHIHICIYIYRAHIHWTHMHLNTYTFEHISTHMYYRSLLWWATHYVCTPLQIHTYRYTCTYMYTSMSIHIHVRIYIHRAHIDLHTHWHTNTTGVYTGGPHATSAHPWRHAASTGHRGWHSQKSAPESFHVVNLIARWVLRISTSEDSKTYSLNQTPR